MPAAYVTEREKRMIRTILSRPDKKMSTTDLKARAETDFFIEVCSVHAMCYTLKNRGFLEMAERVRGAKGAGKLLCVWKVTPKGVEALTYERDRPTKSKAA